LRLKTLDEAGEAGVRENLAVAFMPFCAARQGISTGGTGFATKMKYFPKDGFAEILGGVVGRIAQAERFG
jgi:hypothetical protein